MPPPPPPPRTAADVLGDLDLSDDARRLLTPKVAPEAYFDALVKAGLYPDAIRFTSRLLSAPQGVWWGCLSVWHGAKPAPDAPAGHALRAAVAWLRDPTDEKRRAAGDAGRAAGAASPAGLLGAAVFLSGGSLAPAGQKDVPPPPGTAATCVANAVLVATRTGPAAGTAARQREILALAVDVYRGANTWAGK